MSNNTALSTTTAINTGLALPQDIEIPRLNVIQKMSQIDAPTGAVVIDKEDVLLEAEERTNIIIVSASKRWKEDVPFDEEVVPKIVLTEPEAKQLESESDYDVIEFAELVMLIPQTGEDDSLFPYPIGDTNYQLGRLTVQKDAYRLTYKKLFTFAFLNRETPPSAIYWDFGTELMTKGKYSWYVPTLNSTKIATPEVVTEFIKGFTSNN